jgi:hypothetical protein
MTNQTNCNFLNLRYELVLCPIRNWKASLPLKSSYCVAK